MRVQARITGEIPAAAVNPSRTSVWFEELLPAGVATAELFGAGDPALLLAAEWPLLGGAALARASEFAAGRLCARNAVAQFGFVDFPIRGRDDRRPQWPPRLTGSITHTDGFSAAAVGERRCFRAIGIDAEKIGGVSRELWSYVLLPAEISWLKRLPAPEQAKVATLMFSAKEAFYKCQYEVTEQWLEFRDVTVQCYDWALGWGSFAVRPAGSVRLFEHDSNPVLGRFAIKDDLVLTAMAIATH